MQNLKLFVTLFGALLLAFMVPGCQSDSPVSAPINLDIQAEPLAATGAPGISSATVTPIALPNGTSIKPFVKQSISVTPREGGVLDTTMTYMSADNKRPVVVHAILQVPAGAVNGAKTITMTIDTSVVGVEFSPKGLKFGENAVLSLEVTNVDGVSKGTSVGFFYFDDNNNSQPEPVAGLTVSANAVAMKGGKVPHFSRYAFGRKYYQSYIDQRMIR